MGSGGLSQPFSAASAGTFMGSAGNFMGSGRLSRPFSGASAGNFMGSAAIL